MNVAAQTDYEADLAARAPALAGRGLPHRRVEEWKWTDVRAALRQAPSAAGAITRESAFAAADAYVVDVFADAFERPAPDGVTIRAEAPRAVDAEGHPLAAIADALAPRVVRIAIAPGVDVSRPILLRAAAAGEAHAAIAIDVGEGARARFFEEFDAADGAFANGHGRATLGAGAALERVVLQSGGEMATLASVFDVVVGENARFAQTTLAFGAKLARLETRLRFEGAGAAARLSGAALLGGARHADQTSRIEFAAPACEARQVWKSAVAETARAVFQGKFFVERAAQKTDARMSADALLLSDRAEANHKPELEIYADDVECAHGSTSGALDEAALFYMRQRGLEASAARRLLVEAFIREAFDGLAEGPAADALRALIAAWLEEAYG
ncbi:MAG: Fe-S cluster assembly protein SufD [Parvularculaceae bacterium]